MRTSLRYATPYMSSSWGVAAMTASSTTPCKTPQRYSLCTLQSFLQSFRPARHEVTHTGVPGYGGDAQHSALAALGSDRGLPGLHADHEGH